jgi:hypothetical protein
MSDISGHRAPDSFVEAPRWTRAGLRYAVLILIAACVVVWICSRPWTKSLQATVSSDRILEVIARAGLQPTGYFHEPATGLVGVEISAKECPQPVALLPAMVGDIELAPDELSYRDGDYQVAYAFNGNLYPPRWISYRLEVIATWRRLISLASGSDPERLRYYMKIWTPSGCQGLTSQELARLRDVD